MKMIMAVIHSDDLNAVNKALYKNNFQSTRLATTGGFLSAGNSTIIVGCKDEDVEKVCGLIQSESQKREEVVPAGAPLDVNNVISAPINVTVGGATIFVLNIEEFRKV